MLRTERGQYGPAHPPAGWPYLTQNEKADMRENHLAESGHAGFGRTLPLSQRAILARIPARL